MLSNGHRHLQSADLRPVTQPAKNFQEENAGGKPDPTQAEIVWSGFKLVCPEYSLTCVVYVSNGTMSSDLPTEAGQSLSRE